MTSARSTGPTTTSARARTAGLALNATPRPASAIIAQVVRAVADRDRPRRAARRPRPPTSRSAAAFASASTIAAVDDAGQRAVGHGQAVRAPDVDAELGCDRVEDLVEAAGDDAHPAAALVHGVDELAHAGRRLDPREHAGERASPARPRAPARASADSPRSRPRRASPPRSPRRPPRPRPASSAMSSMTSLRISVESASSTTRKRADGAGMPSTLAARHAVEPARGVIGRRGCPFRRR